MPRKEREIELGEKAKRFTNVYVKNFNEAMTEEDLSKMFEKFGKITSLKVQCILDARQYGCDTIREIDVK